MEKTAPRLALPANPLLELLHDDCLSAMRDFPDASIDLICADLPYEITAMDWDRRIDMDAIWSEFRRIIKPAGIIVCHAVQPFTTDLINAARDIFCYALVWQKSRPSGHLRATERPLTQHEDLLIFSPGKPRKRTYNPVGAVDDKVRRKKHCRTRLYGDTIEPQNLGSEYMAKTGYPRSVQHHDTPHKPFHPTAKPESLMEFIVGAYSNPGDVVLDPTMGSGTTGVACARHDRQFIGIERDEEYFVHAYHRIRTEHSNLQKSAA